MTMSPPTNDWTTATLEELIAAQKRLIQEIDNQIDALLKLTPLVRAKLHEELGWVAAPDHSRLAEKLAQLVAASEGTPRRRGRKRGSGAKDRRFMLVYKADNSPVMDEDGNPLRFKTKLRILRGPRYAELLGRQGVSKVRLLDTELQTVVVEDLKLGPAPGRQRPTEQ